MSTARRPIASNWPTKTIAESTMMIMDYRGRTPRKLGMSWGEGVIPALSARNVRMGKIDFSEECHLGSDALYRRWMTSGDMEPGDTLITTEAPLGNVAPVPDSGKYILSQRTVLLRPNPRDFDKTYFLKYLQSASFQRLLMENATGSTALGIQRKRLEQLPIAQPPMSEQRFIGSVLADADSSIEALERVIAKKQAVKQGMAHELLTGKTRLPRFVKPWQEFSLGDAAEFGKGAGLAKSELVAGGELPCIHYGELFTHYGAEIHEVTSSTNSSSVPVRSSEMDVLMPASDVTPRGLAKASAIHQSGVGLGGDILVIRPNQNQIYGPFLAHLIRHDANQVLRLVRGSTIFHIYAADMRNFNFLAPEIEEQAAICAILRDAQVEIDRLTARLNKAIEIKQGLMQVLLAGSTRPLDMEHSA